ncbi:MAG TPA: FAD-binding oxidoreductase [Alphaproteobacteria bacterium]|nr:FAD-binding oxidoreductase [Alphaproteobacteria bacterium]
MTEADFLVVGAGIAGASAAAELAAHGRVVVLERESQPGYHSTGRSAALYTETYGNHIIRALTVASGRFLRDPPAGFADHPLLTPRGTLLIGRADQRDALDAAHAELRGLAPGIARVDLAAALALVPVLDRSYVASGIYEADATDMDVHGIHGGFLKTLRARGGRVVTDAEVTALAWRGGRWHAVTRAGEFSAPVVVNAAGAWCDELARLAGVLPVGLVPKRRTAFTFDPPAGADVRHWPAVIDIAETFYFKPEAGKILGSPADETPMPPQDVQPDELDIALAVERIERASSLRVIRLEHRWAGLRSFVADKTPVVGMDDRAEGFFWLAGQGGYGIMTSPALGRTVASLLTAGTIPEDLATLGVTREALVPARFR